jgi:hypothetical protein
MATPKIEKMIQKLSSDLEKLKVAVALSSQSESKKTKSRPASIDLCTKKSQLMMFTIPELKSWLIEKKAEKLSGLNKDDLIKLVVKKLKKDRVLSASSAASSTADSIMDQLEVTSNFKMTGLDEVDDIIPLSSTSGEQSSSTLLAEIMKLIAESQNK